MDIPQQCLNLHMTATEVESASLLSLCVSSLLSGRLCTPLYCFENQSQVMLHASKWHAQSVELLPHINFGYDQVCYAPTKEA